MLSLMSVPLAVSSMSSGFFLFSYTSRIVYIAYKYSPFCLFERNKYRVANELPVHGEVSCCSLTGSDTSLYRGESGGDSCKAVLELNMFICSYKSFIFFFS